MLRRLLVSLILCTASIFTMLAQSVNANADSINRAAQAEDFIKVSLVYAHTGYNVYSMLGHALLRLQSPSNNLDIIYTFETETSAENIFRFFRGNAQAGFVYAPTQVVLDDYRRQGRQVDEIELGLLPKQEQRLWQYLDNQLAHHVMYRYDYLEANCSVMLIDAVEKAISPAKIRYNDLPEALRGGYGAFRKGSYRVPQGHEWYLIFWNFTLGRFADSNTNLNQLLTPNFIFETWPKASVIEPDGSEHPLIKGKPVTLVSVDPVGDKFPVTPDHVAILLLIIVLVATFVKKVPACVGRIADGILMTIQTTMGIWVFYLSPIVGAISTDWNFLLGLYNPLPILLWLIFRKKPVMRHIYLVWTVVALIYLIATPLLPQMQIRICMPILAACFALRSATAFKRL